MFLPCLNKVYDDLYLQSLLRGGGGGGEGWGFTGNGQIRSLNGNNDKKIIY